MKCPEYRAVLLSGSLVACSEREREREREREELLRLENRKLAAKVFQTLRASSACFQASRVAAVKTDTTFCKT